MVNEFIPCHPSNCTKSRTGRISYLVLHYTSNDGDTAKGNCNYFSGANRSASAHYFVDENVIYQSVADADTAWHCGTSSGYKHAQCRNANSIGIELCSRKDANGSFYIKGETVALAVKLTRVLMAQYGIGAGCILRHYDVTGKECPRPWVRDESQWRAFLADLAEEGHQEEETEMAMITYQTIEDVPEWGRQAVQALLGKGYLQGDDTGALNLTQDLVRMIVINHRAGLYQ